jgi:uncharacterized protein (DUF983 family)
MPDVNRPFNNWKRFDPVLLDEAAKRAAQIVMPDLACPGREPKTLKAALWRGVRCICPACGAARLFSAFLKPVLHCPACHQDWSHQRADDFPLYIVILVTGHLVVPCIALVETTFHPPTWVNIALWLALVTLLCVGLLQPAKGGVIAYQWWLGMGGFEGRSTVLLLGKNP